MKSKKKLKEFFNNIPWKNNKYDEYDATIDIIEDYLVGRKIIGVQDETLFLDNGVTLTAGYNNDCCAWYDVKTELSDTLYDKRGYLREMIITGVVRNEDDEHAREVLKDRNKELYSPEAFSIRVLSDAKELAVFNSIGNSTSGYYCESFSLRIGSWDTSLLDEI